MKEKSMIVPILVFLDWLKEFDVHVDALSIVLGTILSQLGEGEFDHPIAFSSRKLSIVEKNYTTMEREGLVMVYCMQKYYLYLSGSHFKLYIDHSYLKYLIKNPFLRVRICY